MNMAQLMRVAFQSPTMATRHEIAIGEAMRREASASKPRETQRKYYAVGLTSKFAVLRGEQVAALLAGGPMTAAEIAAALNLKPRAVTTTLVLMRASGQVKCTEPNLSAYGAPRTWSLA